MSKDAATQFTNAVSAVRVAAIVTTVIAVASSFFPSLRLWGFNHLAYYPLASKILASAVLVIALVPAISRRMAADVSRICEAIRSNDRRVTLVLILVAVAFMTMFAAFHSATELLGDGQLIAQSFEAAEKGNPTVIMRSAQAILAEEQVACGDRLIRCSV